MFNMLPGLAWLQSGQEASRVHSNLGPIVQSVSLRELAGADGKVGWRQGNDVRCFWGSWIAEKINKKSYMNKKVVLRKESAIPQMIPIPIKLIDVNLQYAYLFVC